MRTLVTSLLLALVVAAPAAAAEQQTLSRDSPTASFQGKLGIGFHYSDLTRPVGSDRCTAQDINCERTLVRVQDRGRLTVAVRPDGPVPSFPYVVETVHTSDATGREGERVDRGSVVADAPAGFYLLVVRWTDGPGRYKADLRLEPREDVAGG